MNDLVKIADKIAEELHRGQVRKGNGHPYIEHPRAVAAALMKKGWTQDIILSAALLHDTVEDCAYKGRPLTGETLCSLLMADGAEAVEAAMIVELVMQLTSLDKQFPLLGQLKRAERKRIQVERLAFVSKPAVLIKCYDRLSNLREMETHDMDFQILYFKESVALLSKAKLFVDTGVQIDIDEALQEVGSRLKFAEYTK